MDLSITGAGLILPLTLIIIAAAVAAVLKSKLTPAAGVTGVLLSVCILLGVGWQGLLYLAMFFGLATWATRHKKQVKAAISGTEPHTERRKATQVLANGGVAGLLGLAAILYPAAPIHYLVLIAASFSSATADTLSSELGTVYGKRFYNVLSFKEDQKGLDGVISLEGTLIGAAGAAMIAFVYALLQGFSGAVVVIWLAGVLGNLTDSLLGAAFERKHQLGNDMVNFLNTAFAALIAWASLQII
ncbi:uncharacterized protein (TIGR00297 family) [Chitinophaga dinghuensis]|uniref:Uncharacterized protein (TIGR00297 family) n=1 Tax=Chitinophaga dinghuensis TaxID=1539050 RepID=A0A327VMH7_9BACT|nr:DUF92 domain-containing protein [Chitinophaga dinghuensis]RAJ76541.1 uncharacterized protein (TIGR00297 family) [Chitinophaga dinghuensis]